MANDDAPADLRAEEFREVVREIRERVRAQHPTGQVGNVALPDLAGVLHARDAAEAKVASIGTVNPRRPGAVNALVQSAKRLAARLLDWHVREQVEFNRAIVDALGALLEALNENNRALKRLADSDASAKAEIEEIRDLRSHWAEWRQEWERKLSVNEIQFLRSVADLQGAFQQRVALFETNLRELTKSQHGEFAVALDRATLDIQGRLWADLDKVRAEFERLIHAELRLVRQRAAAAPAATLPALPPAPPGAAGIDFLWFAERFRGGEEHVREKQRFYVTFFQGRGAVVDLGCGRGEFLELMREAGVDARGVDLSEECVTLCHSKGLKAEKADLFGHLGSLAEASLDGVFCAQVVEHLAPERIPEMIRLAASRLQRGGLLVIETPNPECLAALSSHFYLDPTHQRPVPSALLKFYMEEFGLGQIEIHSLSPAVETMPAVASLPADFREAFFAGLDFGIIGRKL